MFRRLYDRERERERKRERERGARMLLEMYLMPLIAGIKTVLRTNNLQQFEQFYTILKITV